MGGARAASSRSQDIPQAKPPQGASAAQPEVGKAIVVDGKPRNSTKEPTWRVEILMPQSSGLNHSGKLRTMCIRGPQRLRREQAEEDAAKLEKLAEGGETRAVKDAANEMVRNATYAL